MSAPPSPGGKPKGRPIQRTAKQEAAIEKREEANALEDARTAAAADAAQLAQVVNLVIAGHSFESIGASIGASASDVERMVTSGADRYVRTQPALRVWVRNWLSEKYTKMIDANWEAASDADHRDKLENQDRVIKMLNGLERLHGAAAPTQSEVKVEGGAEAVERIVAKLAAAQGQGYDTSIFDTVDAEVIHDTADASLAALEQASRDVAIPTETDGDLRT